MQGFVLGLGLIQPALNVGCPCQCAEEKVFVLRTGVGCCSRLSVLVLDVVLV